MGIIDVHGHVTHPELFKLLPMPPALADIDGMIEQKEAVGVELTIVGSPVGWGTMVPVPGRDNFDQPVDRLKSFHEWLAGVVADHPGKLAAYAYTNPFGGEKLLEEAARTVREGGFVGLIVNTSVRGEYLDSPAADDFFAMADELGRPVFLHPPAEPVGSSSVRDFRLVEQVLRFTDVAVALAALALSGRLERHPKLKLIAATCGGPISLAANRVDKAARMPRRDGGGPPGGGPPPPAGPPPSQALRRVYVDTANESQANQLGNLELVGAEHMLFGTDSPPLTSPIADAIARVRELPISDADKQRILEQNARDLFGL